MKPLPLRQAHSRSSGLLRIDYRLGVNRKAKSRQGLRYKNAHAWVVDGKLSMERVDRKYGRIGRKPEYRLYVSAGLEVRVQLAKEGLEKAILEKLRRIRNTVHR